MNTFRCLSLTGYNTFRSIFDQHSIQTTVNDKISAASSLAISSLKCISEKIYNQLIGRFKHQHSSSTNTPATISEELLSVTCKLGFYSPNKEEERRLIQEAKDLINEGTCLHPSLFKGNPLEISWLRIHCTRELLERAAVSKKGLELIDFETMLPLDWQPPKWLPTVEKLEVPEGVQIEPNQPSTPLFKIKKTPLNQNDMQRLHSKALQNPLYVSLWKKVEALEACSPISLTFAPLSKFKSSSLAQYNSVTNKIEIYEGKSERRAFESLIFESVNASQKNSFNKIDKKANQGKIDREEYVRLTEYIEWNSLNLYHQIVNFGKDHLGWQKNKSTLTYYTAFREDWEMANIHDSETKKSHSDTYRNVWDNFGFLYWLRHPEKAPTGLDWINRRTQSDSISPLEKLAWHPEWAALWKTDPFIQFIDKGAKVDDDLVSCLLLEAISDTQYTDVNAARIRKLLELGVSLPKDLGPKEKAWLETNVKQDLRE